jgi:hypothetical protein
MTVDARSYKSRLADENFKKEINYKLLAGWVHAELGDGNYLTVNSIDYKRSDFLMVYSDKPWKKKAILELSKSSLYILKVI